MSFTTVPPSSVVVHNEPVDSLGGERRDVLIAPADTGFNLASVETREADGAPAANTKGALAPASMTVARTNSLGVIFVATLFQPERAALKGTLPPLVRALVEACVERQS